MFDRRKFIKISALSGFALAIPSYLINLQARNIFRFKSLVLNKPVVISTWSHGLAANKRAWEIMEAGGRALDAVEKGINVPELDPSVTSVGYGGLPDRDGKVTLDACIMDEMGNCGSVAFLEYIKTPVSVARLVMEKTPHVMLAGSGALEFALANGFKKEELLTPASKARWDEWLKTSDYTPVKSGEDNHDTIGLLAMSADGNLSAGCSTSGLAWKYHGRVGDSPIIGAGMFCDNETGAAAATGKGEAVIKISGSHLIVELMRQGKSPQEACEMAVQRIISKNKDYKDFQVGFIALNKNGEYGAFSISGGFEYAISMNNEHRLVKAESYIKK
jgi:N4-(beta-N-acetylglucosaminyl)-L-asparaginase